ncbi:amino acid deaminase/aldolase [Nocardioides bizhenqiangii]|uniref:Amino acid deaminase/aldolase n=1 Tax=Nocardioides bizhenqiangii TaxID=3095076 RepID=A0ABZ0ZRL3_9ACTN|nr:MULTISPECIES: amino acid deaminase/aldolase [unclassified Nocardioides]MDZ5619262.1 amino acid deaminase/aldolase [Nocardioides sp. HM23]WQQ26715.1 amino acid deaminase/aldolase [Nocardioides sp. HM61]
MTLQTTATGPTSYDDLARATADLETPYAVLDLGAFHANAEDLVRRAAGTPIRVASKSVRCREVISRTLALPGYAGVLAFTLPEALWLARDIDDVVVGYPSVDRAALALLAGDELLASRVTLMIDSIEQLELTAAAIGPGGPPIRVCVELDASLRLVGGRVHLGARRSPTHTPAEAAALAQSVVDHPRFTLVGLMAYEGQIAGVGDNQPGLRKHAVRAMQRLSARELAGRRAAAVAAVREVAPLEFVNGGGTGSIESTAAEAAVTEIAAGSGLFGPHLFDHYRRFRPQPAVHFALSVVRRPSPRHATVLGGGWVASGAIGPDRLPTPVWPRGLELVPAEGAGEVQTPLTGAAAAQLRIGDRVWFRHTKAGEVCEHVDALHLVADGEVVGTAPTYRGEGKAFL